MAEDIANNRKALRDYHIVDRYEAGLALKGTEVKSIRLGHVNINEVMLATSLRPEGFLVIQPVVA